MKVLLAIFAVITYSQFWPNAACKEMADGCGMNPLLALVAVAEKTGQSVESLMGKFSSDKIAFREFVGLLGRYESCIRVGSGARYR